MAKFCERAELHDEAPAAPAGGGAVGVTGARTGGAARATGGSGAAAVSAGRSPGMIDSTIDLAAAALRDAEPVRRRVRQVDDAAVQERAAVVDAHDDALAGARRW